MTDDTASNGASGRGSGGRFGRGNTYGRGHGNPAVKRMAELQAAVRDAVSAEDLKAVLGKLVDLAKGGDTQAAKIVLDRCLGKVAVADDTAQEALELPPIVSTESVLEALSIVFTALGDGRLSPDSAMKVAGVVELGRRALETADMDRRIAALEEERLGHQRRVRKR